MEDKIVKEKTSTTEEQETNKETSLENTLLNIKDGITAYEGKVLTVIISAVITLVFALIMYVARQDISDNLTYIVITFICAIAGVSSAEQFFSGSRRTGIKK